MKWAYDLNHTPAWRMPAHGDRIHDQGKVAAAQAHTHRQQPARSRDRRMARQAHRMNGLLHLLDDDPLLETELRRVLDEQLVPLLPPAGQQHVRISMMATASGNAQVIQAGHDVITGNDHRS